MYKMYKSTFNLIIFFLLIAYIFSDDPIDPETNIPCTLDEDCDTCIFCGNTTLDYSQCSYVNIFCHHIQNDNYEYNSNLKSKYSAYFHSDVEIDSFCGENNILLNTMRQSFTLLKTSSNLLTKAIHCDYDISNEYYYSHDSDQAKLHFEIIKLNTGNRKIKFDLFMIYKIGNSLRFTKWDDENIRENIINKTLDKVSDVEILIDFKNTELSIDEYLEISILTDNPSKKTKIIYIVVLVICGFLVMLIVILIILYICIKKKMEDRFREINEENVEKEKKMKENKKKIEQLYETILRPQIFSNDILNNNCNNTICSICTDNFEVEKSEVMITPCKHIFHYTCLKPWIDNNILTPKCPNCNYNILDSVLLSKPVDIAKKNDGHNNNEHRSSIIAINNTDNNNRNNVNSNNNNIPDSGNNNVPDSGNNVIHNNDVSEGAGVRNNGEINSRDPINN